MGVELKNLIASMQKLTRTLCTFKKCARFRVERVVLHSHQFRTNDQPLVFYKANEGGVDNNKPTVTCWSSVLCKTTR